MSLEKFILEQNKYFKMVIKEDLGIGKRDCHIALDWLQENGFVLGGFNKTNDLIEQAAVANQYGRLAAKLYGEIIHDISRIRHRKSRDIGGESENINYLKTIVNNTLKLSFIVREKNPKEVKMEDVRKKLRTIKKHKINWFYIGGGPSFREFLTKPLEELTNYELPDRVAKSLARKY